MPLPRETWKSWWIALGGLVIVMAVSELTSIDLWVQDFFYDVANGQWMVGKRDSVPRALFYTGPKYVIILLGVGLLTLLCGRQRWRDRWQVSRSGLGVVLLVLGLAPALIGFLKGATGVYCPWDIRRYGGPAPYVRVLERHPIDDKPDYAGRGFPAGHASGGFALIGLAALAKTRRQRQVVFGVALAMGWWMGTYQLAKGAHYISHNFVTMGIVWMIYVPIQRALQREATSPGRVDWGSAGRTD